MNKDKLLLQVCCATCAGYLVSQLKERFDITLFFCNPNLNNFEEYNKRLFDVKKLADLFELKLVITEYKHEVWLDKVQGLEQEPEKGNRCFVCYEDRLRQTAELAKRNNFDYFGTTLLISPYKNTQAINNIGQNLAEEFGVKYFFEDFQANNGFRKAMEFSKEHEFYRQKFCGCEFSK